MKVGDWGLKGVNSYIMFIFQSEGLAETVEANVTEDKKQEYQKNKESLSGNEYYKNISSVGCSDEIPH
jgi:hypothetical protein